MGRFLAKFNIWRGNSCPALSLSCVVMSAYNITNRLFSKFALKGTISLFIMSIKVCRGALNAGLTRSKT